MEMENDKRNRNRKNEILECTTRSSHRPPQGGMRKKREQEMVTEMEMVKEKEKGKRNDKRPPSP
jgi:hypothetical protein